MPLYEVVEYNERCGEERSGDSSRLCSTMRVVMRSRLVDCTSALCTVCVVF